MTRRTVSIAVDPPLRGHDGPIKTVVLREPSYGDFLRLGETYVIAGSADGSPVMIEDIDVIRRYIEACLVEPKDAALLEQGNALLARAVKNAIVGFFDKNDPGGTVKTDTVAGS